MPADLLVQGRYLKKTKNFNCCDKGEEVRVLVQYSYAYKPLFSLCTHTRYEFEFLFGSRIVRPFRIGTVIGVAPSRRHILVRP